MMDNQGDKENRKVNGRQWRATFNLNFSRRKRRRNRGMRKFKTEDTYEVRAGGGVWLGECVCVFVCEEG